MNRSDIEGITNRIINFLLDQQITVDHIEIKVKDVRVAEVPIRLFSNKSIQLFAKTRDNHIYLSTDEKNWTKAVKKKDIFRVDLSGDITFAYPAPFIQRLNTFRWIKLPKYRSALLGTYHDSKWELVKKLTIKKWNFSLADTEGVTFFVDTVKRSEDTTVLGINCWDYGGIFDYYLNTEGRYYPPQVAGDYYADAYAAILFLNRYLETRESKYLQASARAIEFIIMHYDKGYPAYIFPHTSDFKNPILLELYIELKKRSLLTEQVEKIEKVIPFLREDYYSPTNVYCLRLHWHSLAYAITGRPYHEKRMYQCLQRIKIDITPDGLLMDNIYPEFSGILDLTYHCYAVACLARAYETCTITEFKKELIQIIDKAATFSLSIQTQSGEVSYIGRGANNLYHLASCFYVFCFMHKQLRVTHKDRSDRFLFGAVKIMNYLECFQQSDGFFPTCLNPHIEERLGWNHCETPYNALSAYFINNGLDLIDATDIQDNETTNKFIQLKDSQFIIYKGLYDLSVFAGGKRSSYFYSDGTHRSGVGGIACFCFKGESLLPILDETSEDSPPASDLPLIVLNGKFHGFLEPGKISLEENHTIVLTNKNDFFEFRKCYTCLQNRIQVSVEINILARFEGELIPIHVCINEDDSLEVNASVLTIENEKYRFGYTFDENTKIGFNETRHNNPRGKIRILDVNSVHRKFEKGDSLTFEYAIFLD